MTISVDLGRKATKQTNKQTNKQNLILEQMFGLQKSVSAPGEIQVLSVHARIQTVLSEGVLL